MAILTGGQVISEEVGLKLENTTLDLLGEARKVVVTKDDTTIVEGAGATDDVKGRIAQIKREIDDTDSDWDREKLQERLAKLAGGVAVVKVGAATEVELKEKKHRIEDALSATRAAIEEGVVAGGGTALLRARAAVHKVVEKLEGDEATGARSRRSVPSRPRLGSSPTTPASKVPSSCSRSSARPAPSASTPPPASSRTCSRPASSTRPRSPGRRCRTRRRSPACCSPPRRSSPTSPKTPAPVPLRGGMPRRHGRHGWHGLLSLRTPLKCPALRDHRRPALRGRPWRVSGRSRARRLRRMDRPPPDPAKLLADWMEWERGENPPGA